MPTPPTMLEGFVNARPRHPQRFRTPSGSLQGCAHALPTHPQTHSDRVFRHLFANAPPPPGHAQNT
eukprot:1553918-Lingulodinium_polyedra.AAC.1